MDAINRRSRPIMCPCQKTCTPIFNGLAGDDRITSGDMNEGYSGDCIGKSLPIEYVVGGNVHSNDMNHCIFTPLKGVIRYQINEGDVESMVHMCKQVLLDLHPEYKCDQCSARHRFTHFIIQDGRRLCCDCARGIAKNP